MQTVNDIKNNIWDAMTFIIDNPEYRVDGTMMELADANSEEGTPKWMKVLAIQRYYFELKYLANKPIETMRLLFSDHVDLSYTHGCDKHHFIIKTSDRARENTPDNQTVFCPYCNIDNMLNKNREEYISLMGGYSPVDCEWETYINWSKFDKKFNEKKNREYKFQRLIDRIKYNISKMFTKNS